MLRRPDRNATIRHLHPIRNPGSLPTWPVATPGRGHFDLD
jgi:hypothetical protein